MRKTKYIPLSMFLLISTQAFCYQLSDGHINIQAGGFVSDPGEAQDVNIRHIRGDYYNLTSKHDSNALVGLSYLVKVAETERYAMELGVDAFYLAKTSVQGQIVQEHRFANLAYHYDVTHLPVYALAKGTIKKSDKLAFVIDAGIGPNFTNTTNFDDWAINQSNALPDHAYYGRSTSVLSATAGIGVKINNVFGDRPLECGYRFFYLGKSSLNTRSDQWLTNLNTGPVYANALICGVTV